MPDLSPSREQQPKRCSRMLVLVMLGTIVVLISAFLVLRPDPLGIGHSSTNTTSDH